MTRISISWSIPGDRSFFTFEMWDNSNFIQLIGYDYMPLIGFKFVYLHFSLTWVDLMKLVVLWWWRVSPWFICHRTWEYISGWKSFYVTNYKKVSYFHLTITIVALHNLVMMKLLIELLSYQRIHYTKADS